MGLSGSRKRAKISHDPNNTAWTRSEARLGQKLLLSQGWTPGSPLGAINVPYTNNPGSISHIRIKVRDDNRGLGMRNGFHDDDRPTTGFEGFQDLLGRLNGKDHQLLQAEQRNRADSRRAIYAEKHRGFDRFVSGGLLLGDKLQQQEATPTDLTSLKNQIIRSGTDGTGDVEISEVEKRHSERAYKATASGSLGAPARDSQQSSNLLPEFAEHICNAGEAESSINIESHMLETERLMERKAQRRARKKQKTAARALNESEKEEHRIITSVVAQDEATMTQVPQTTRAYGRHAIRQRSIRHKKMSLTDQKALNEV
ncbi:MAG: hypothetical protein Q9209_005580 [Squamulea sp. 1 TL-2023]